MAYSYDYKHTAEIKSEQREQPAGRPAFSPVINRGVMQMIAGFLLMGALLLGSWSLDGLFMSELLAVTFIWGLISVIRLKDGTE